MNAPALAIVTPQPLPLRAEDFIVLAESGAFEGYAKTELIEGELLVVNAQWSRHARIKSRLLVALAARLLAIRPDLEVMSEATVRLSDHSMPEPDLVVTTFRGEGPVPVETVALLVEVSDTTLETDLGRKARLYAQAGVPEYWVVDLAGRRILRHTHRSGDAYDAPLALAFGESIKSITVPGLELATDALV